MVRVVDRGPGVPHEELTRIFDAFYRAPGVRTGHTGSGLGLAIVKGFVEAKGGRVWAESLPGHGDELRRGVPRGARGARTQSGRRRRPRVTDRPRVLVCDDEPHIVRALKIMMREAGFETLAAGTVAEALQVASLQPPDAAILDLVLPALEPEDAVPASISAAGRRSTHERRALVSNQQIRLTSSTS